MGISDELYDLLENYQYSKFQTVILIEQTSSWKPVLAVIPQTSALGSLVFLINDTSLFTTAKDIKKC